jgi:hypothetical protein
MGNWWKKDEAIAGKWRVVTERAKKKQEETARKIKQIPHIRSG